MSGNGSALPALRTRRPTGAVPWPFVLLEGGEKSGKSWQIAELSASERVGTTYWMDLGEGAADEYGAIPGTRYEVVIHDGSYQSIMEQARAIWAEGKRAAEAGEPPVVWALDSMTLFWDMLRDWADGRARERLVRKGRKPGEDVTISMDLWNDAGSRHGALVTLMLTFPGIVVATARGKEVAALDESGKPIEGTKAYKVEGQKNLAYDATVWVRLSRDHSPRIVGCRSVHYGVRPGRDAPRETPDDFTLERLIFDVLKCDPATSRARDLQPLHGGPATDQEEPPETTARPAAAKAQPARPAAPTTPARTPENARDAVTHILAAETLADAEKYARMVARYGDGPLDATPHVPEDDREVLGGHELGETFTVDQLVAAVLGYWLKHEHGPRQVPEPAAETTETEQPAGELEDWQREGVEDHLRWSRQVERDAIAG